MPKALSDLEIAVVAWGLTLLIFAVQGFISVLLEGREVRAGRIRPHLPRGIGVARALGSLVLVASAIILGVGIALHGSVRVSGSLAGVGAIVLALALMLAPTKKASSAARPISTIATMACPGAVHVGRRKAAPGAGPLCAHHTTRPYYAPWRRRTREEGEQPGEECGEQVHAIEHGSSGGRQRGAYHPRRGTPGDDHTTGHTKPPRCRLGADRATPPGLTREHNAHSRRVAPGAATRPRRRGGRAKRRRAAAGSARTSASPRRARGRARRACCR